MCRIIRDRELSRARVEPAFAFLCRGALGGARRRPPKLSDNSPRSPITTPGGLLRRTPDHNSLHLWGPCVSADGRSNRSGQSGGILALAREVEGRDNVAWGRTLPGDTRGALASVLCWWCVTFQWEVSRIITSITSSLAAAYRLFMTNEMATASRSCRLRSIQDGIWHDGDNEACARTFIHAGEQCNTFIVQVPGSQLLSSSSMMW
jgi:hypothetical protein